MAKLYVERNEYVDSHTGELKEALNYYVLYGEIKIQLRPADFTGREILNLMVNQDLIKEK